MKKHAFLQKLLGGNSVEWVAVEELFLLRKGRRPSASPESTNTTTHRTPLFTLVDLIGSEKVVSDASHHLLLSEQEEAFPANSIVVAPAAGLHVLVTVKHVCTHDLISCNIKNEYANLLDVRFAHHYFFLICEQVKTRTAIPANERIAINDTRKELLPIPCPGRPKESLEIQREITRILDTFTELDVESRKQFTLQRKQHEYYRYQLLNFPK